jgi:subtilisin family serine protease
VAVIDVGVDTDHPALAEFIGKSQVDLTGGHASTPSFSHNNHGTAAAGLIASSVNAASGLLGSRPNVRIIPIKYAYHERPASDWIAVDGAQRNAINTAVELGARVVLCPWQMPEDHSVTDAIRTAIMVGCVIVCSVGNHGPLAPNAVTYPATLAGNRNPVLRDGVIAVSAINQFGEFKTHRFETEIIPSSDTDFGWGSNRGEEVSLAATGVELATTDNEGAYMTFSGTSAAAALVAGAAAVLLSLNTSACPGDIKSWLQQGADPMGPETPNKFFGHGRLNLAGAMRVARESIGAETCSD